MTKAILMLCREINHSLSKFYDEKFGKYDEEDVSLAKEIMTLIKNVNDMGYSKTEKEAKDI